MQISVSCCTALLCFHATRQNSPSGRESRLEPRVSLYRSDDGLEGWDGQKRRVLLDDGLDGRVAGVNLSLDDGGSSGSRLDGGGRSSTDDGGCDDGDGCKGLHAGCSVDGIRGLERHWEISHKSKREYGGGEGIHFSLLHWQVCLHVLHLYGWTQELGAKTVLVVSLPRESCLSQV